MDVIEAYKHVNVEKEQLKGMHKNAKTTFASSVREKIKKMAKLLRNTPNETRHRKT